MNCDICLQKADYAIRYSNTPNFHPICDGCLQEHDQNVREINQHEIDNFDGAYGLCSYELDDLSNYTQKNDREPLKILEEIE